MNNIVLSTSLLEFKEHIRRRYSNNRPGHTNVNSYGFRGNELLPDVDICYYGCSFTFGEYVDIEHTWTSLVDRELKFTSNNFGIPGLGIEEVLLMFATTTKFFKMKKAVFLLPEMFRQYMAIEKSDEKNFRYSTFFPNHKHPYAKEWINMPDCYYIDRALAAIGLIQYIADLNNIKTYWSSWSPDVHKILPNQTIPQFVNDLCAVDKQHPGPVAHYNFAQEVIKAL